MSLCRVLNDIEFHPDADAVVTRLMLPSDSDIAGEVRDMVARSSEIGRPKAIYTVAEVSPIDDSKIKVGNSIFTSKVLAAKVRDLSKVYPYVITCGLELDEFAVSINDPLMRYAADVVKEMALWAAMASLESTISTEEGLYRFSTMNPGSGEVGVWPISEQTPLFALLGDVRDTVGVTLTDSLLMTPNKSVSGIIIETTEDFCTCRLCQRQKCPNRREPFDQDAWMSYGS